MNPFVLAPVLALGKSILGRTISDEEAKKKAQEEFLKMIADKDLDEVIEILEANVNSSAHNSIWAAGWRPAYGWAGALGFIYATFLQPLLSWIAMNSWGWTHPAPEPATDLMMVVVAGLLGLGGMFSAEKIKGSK